MEVGPVPGLYQPTLWAVTGSASLSRLYLFQSFFLPKCKSVFLDKGIKTAEILISNNCSESLHCQTVFVKAIQFLSKMNLKYQKEDLLTYGMEYTTIRPDFQLGRFLSLFADKMFDLIKIFDSSSVSMMR